MAGDADFERDAVYIGDIAGGIAAILLADRLPHDAYNVGWGRGASARQTVAALGRIFPGVVVDWRPHEPSPCLGAGNVARGPLKVDRLTHDLGWQPRHDLDSGLAAYVAWLRQSR